MPDSRGVDELAAIRVVATKAASCNTGTKPQVAALLRASPAETRPVAPFTTGSRASRR
jgi:hypothetical protein